MVAPERYWWGERLTRLDEAEARNLLRSEAAAHGLASVADVRCPLCDSELTGALALTEAGRLAIRPGAQCPKCDFRLDACRHCDHFLPARELSSAFSRQEDFSHGRCRWYRARQPVREAYPQQATQLEALGYDELTAPRPITDSYFPLPECTAFTLNVERLKHSDVPWLTGQRLALLRLGQRLRAR
jgi:hypothetical protein